MINVCLEYLNVTSPSSILLRNYATHFCPSPGCPFIVMEDVMLVMQLVLQHQYRWTAVTNLNDSQNCRTSTECQSSQRKIRNIQSENVSKTECFTTRCNMTTATSVSTVLLRISQLGYIPYFLVCSCEQKIQKR